MKTEKQFKLTLTHRELKVIVNALATTLKHAPIDNLSEVDARDTQQMFDDLAQDAGINDPESDLCTP